MPDDSVMGGLMADALGGRTSSRRIAARLLLDLLQPEPSAKAFKTKVEFVEAEETPEIGHQLRSLIAKHGLEKTAYQ